MQASGEVARATRILFDCHTFDVGPQGTTTFLAGLINALPEALRQRGGSEVEIYCAARSEAAVNRFVLVPHRYLPMPGGFAKRNLIYLPRLSRSIASDFVVSQYVRPMRIHGQTVTVIHDVLFLDFPQLFSPSYRLSRRLLFGWSARRSDRLLTVSRYSAGRIAEHFGVAAHNIGIVGNGVSVITSPTDRDVRPGSAVKLLYVSRLEPRKRQQWCIDAVRLLIDRGQKVELTLVGAGEGSYANEVRRLAGAALADNIPVRLLSNLANHEVEQLHHENDLCLFPAECEGFGIPVIEAAALGTPCIVAGNTALLELQGVYVGREFESGSFAAFVTALESGIADRVQLRRAASANAPRAQQAYRWAAVANGFLDAINSERGA